MSNDYRVRVTLSESDETSCEPRRLPHGRWAGWPTSNSTTLFPRGLAQWQVDSGYTLGAVTAPPSHEALLSRRQLVADSRQESSRRCCTTRLTAQPHRNGGTNSVRGGSIQLLRGPAILVLGNGLPPLCRAADGAGHLGRSGVGRGSSTAAAVVSAGSPFAGCPWNPLQEPPLATLNTLLASRSRGDDAPMLPAQVLREDW